MKLVISIPKGSHLFNVNEDTARDRVDPLDTKQRKQRAVDLCLMLVDHFSVNGVFSLKNLDEEAGEFSLVFKGGEIRLSWIEYNPIYGTIQLSNPTEEFREWCIESLKHFVAQHSHRYDVTKKVLV